MKKWFSENIKGLLLCLLIAVPSWLLGKKFPIIGGAVISIILGMIVTVFFKDLLQIINIALQIGMWGTPILWRLDDISEKYHTLKMIFRFNPIYYVIEGYRLSLFEGTWVHERWVETLVFWGIVAVLFLVGSYIFFKGGFGNFISLFITVNFAIEFTVTAILSPTTVKVISINKIRAAA